jgi:hypothetical protein
MEKVAPLEDSMSLRSSLTKLVGSLSSLMMGASPPNPRLRALRIRPSWAGAAGVVGFMAMSASGCNCGGSSLVPCGDAGEFCVCSGYGDCQTVDPGTGGGGIGTGGASSSTGSSTGGAGGAGGKSSTTSSGGTGGDITTGDLTCNADKPCPAPQVCLPDGYCHYPCTDLTECKQIDNRFTACVDGYCE